MLVKRDDKKMRTNYIYYTIGTKTLNRVDAQCDLGVLITFDTCFNEHIYAQVNKANKMLVFFIGCTISVSEQYLP